MKKILLITIMLLVFSGSVKADPLTDAMRYLTPYPILIGDWIIFDPVEL